MKRRTWTAEDVAALHIRYPSEKSEKVAAALGRTVSQVFNKARALGLTKTAEYLASPDACRLRRGAGAETRFRPGQKAWNKGVHFVSGGRSAETQFKPGAKPANHQPVGTIREVAEGYLEIKVAEGIGNWVLLHRHNWRIAHGSFPPDDMVLVFKDKDKKNCAIENLELISRIDLMKRNTRHNLSKELNDVIAVRAALSRQINKREKHEQ